MGSNSRELSPNDWVANYADYLYNIAMYKLNNAALSKDMVQDTFFSALKGKEGFRGEASEKTWLTVILNNKIADYFRKQKNERSIDDYLAATDSDFHDVFFDKSLDGFGHTHHSKLASDWGYHADSRLSDKEFAKILQACIAKIPAKIAGVFLSKYFEGKKAEEICNDFKIKSSNYWVIIHRAKLLLRECLEKNWFVKY